VAADHNAHLGHNDFILPDLNLEQEDLDAVEEGPITMVIDSMVVGSEGSYSD
jgi:hypothetical protein